jgi:excisionase family DNA binding protein
MYVVPMTTRPDESQAAARLTYTVEEVARLLGISRNSAYEAVRRGEIPTIRIGRRILVPRNRLDDLLESR